MNLVQEEHTTIGLFDQTGLGRISTGERPLDMAEYM